MREIHDINQKAPERVHSTKHESREAGEGTRGLEEEWKRSRRGAGSEGRCRSDRRERRSSGLGGKEGKKAILSQDFKTTWSIPPPSCANSHP